MAKLKHLKFDVLRPDPVVWISRIVIYKSLNPLAEIRTIKLHRGLNIVWAQDEEDAIKGPVTVVGHGVGKTTLCRLVRYCLGEGTFGTEYNQKLIQNAFPQGYVAAEVQLKGRQWAVLRPFGARKWSYAAPDATIEQLIDRRSQSPMFDEFAKAIESDTMDELVVGRTMRTMQAMRWPHVLGWCSRDQEARFQEVWQWRASRSGSDPAPLERPKVDGLFLMRAVLGLLVGDEVKVEEELADLESELEETKKNVVERRRVPGYAKEIHTKALRSLLEIPNGQDVPLIAPDLFQPGMDRMVEAKQREMREQVEDIGRQLADLESLRNDEGLKLKRAERQIKLKESLRGVSQQGAAELSSGIAQRNQDREFLATLGDETCDYGSIRIQDCEYVKKRLSVLSFHEGADAQHAEFSEAKRKEAVEELDRELESLRQQRARAEQEQKRLMDESRKLANKRTQIENRIEELALTLAAAQEWSGIMDGKGDEELDKLRAQETTLTKQIEAKRVELGELLARHNDHLAELQSLFDATVKEVLSAKYTGHARLDGDGLSFRITRGSTLGGEAMGTLAILLADVASMVFAATGRGFFPGILIHDSPREADLDRHIYRSFVSLTGRLHRLFVEDEAPFQYIITTTTRPPEDLQNDDVVSLRLNAARDNGMLFRKSIDFTDETSDQVIGPPGSSA